MINDIFNRLEAQENALSGSRILAPVIAGRPVGVRIAGVSCHLKIEFKGQTPHGFGVLEAVSAQRAKWLRPATKQEREKFLSLLPRVRFIALERGKGGWAAFPAGDSGRVLVSGPSWVRGVEEGVQPFDTILARFDGAHFWFEETDARRSPAIASYLRESLASDVAPELLNKKGLSARERAAYALALYGPPLEPELELAPEFGSAIGPHPSEINTQFDWRHDGIEGRLNRSVAHGGARLVSYVERGNVLSVTYKFGDRTHTSTVRASDLKVETSGICLSGRDGDFDLTSLVGVMQEAAKVEPWQFGDEDY